MENVHFYFPLFEHFYIDIYKYEEKMYASEELYRSLSLLCVSLIDLGLIEIEIES